MCSCGRTRACRQCQCRGGVLSRPQPGAGLLLICLHSLDSYIDRALSFHGLPGYQVAGDPLGSWECHGRHIPSEPPEPERAELQVPLLVGEETEAQRGEAAGPMPHSSAFLIFLLPAETSFPSGWNHVLRWSPGWTDAPARQSHGTLCMAQLGPAPWGCHPLGPCLCPCLARSPGQCLPLCYHPVYPSTRHSAYYTIGAQ